MPSNFRIGKPKASVGKPEITRTGNREDAAAGAYGPDATSMLRPSGTPAAPPKRLN